MLMRAGKGHTHVRIIEAAAALHLTLAALVAEIHRAIAQTPAGESEVRIRRTGVEYVAELTLHGSLVGGIQLHGDGLMRQDVLHQPRVALLREPLVDIIVVVIIVIKADGDPLDDIRRELPRAHAPLLGGVIAEESLINFPTHKTQQLLLRVGGIHNALILLGGDELPRLCRIEPLPEKLVNRVQIDGHGEHPLRVGGMHTVHPRHPVRKAIHEGPHPLVTRVENMRPEAMHLHPRFLITGGVAHTGRMLPAVNHQRGNAGLCKAASQYTARQTRANNQNALLHGVTR